MFFLQMKSDKLARHQLEEAKVQLLEHEKAAEYHRAIADMLAKRVGRLNKQVDGEQQ